MTLKAKRRIKVLLLVEVEIGEEWMIAEDANGPHARLADPELCSVVNPPWTTDAVAAKLADSLVRRWPAQGKWWPWRVRSAKQAVAP